LIVHWYISIPFHAQKKSGFIFPLLLIAELQLELELELEPRDARAAVRTANQ
jgi:hypothetical protein